MSVDELLNWAEWPVVLLFATLVVIVAAVMTFVWNRLGNAGDVGKCCICGEPGTKLVPLITGSFWDSAFARSRRLNGIALSYRVRFDATDSRKLCGRHQREHVAQLEAWCDRARADLATFNRDQQATIPEPFAGVKAPEVTTVPAERKPVDSSIELDIGGATP